MADRGGALRCSFLAWWHWSLSRYPTSSPQFSESQGQATDDELAATRSRSMQPFASGWQVAETSR